MWAHAQTKEREEFSNMFKVSFAKGKLLLHRGKKDLWRKSAKFSQEKSLKKQPSQITLFSHRKAPRNYSTRMKRAPWAKLRQDRKWNNKLNNKRHFSTVTICESASRWSPWCSRPSSPPSSGCSSSASTLGSSTRHRSVEHLKYKNRYYVLLNNIIWSILDMHCLLLLYNFAACVDDVDRGENQQM